VPTPPSLRTRIEQAIARGETLDRICDTLNVNPRAVDAVLRRMDAAIAEDDDPHVGLTRSGPRPEPLLQPHGTHAAYNRHRNRSETPCETCVAGERVYQSERERRRTEARRARGDGSHRKRRAA
jgi:hypothetical protein